MRIPRKASRSLARWAKGGRGGLAVSAVLALAFVSVMASSASAASPWWQVSTGARPTNLWLPESQTEAQELTTGLFAGQVFAAKVEVGGKVVGCLGRGEFAGLFTAEELCKSNTPYSAEETAEELEASLERAYGAGNVEVSGGPAGGAAFEVKTPGRWGPPVNLSPLEFVGNPLGTVDAKILTEGSGRLVVTATNLGDAPVSGASTPITITDALPAGISAYGVEGYAGGPGTFSAGPVSCTVMSSSEVSCSFTGELPPYESIEVEIHAALTASPPVAGAPGEVAVSGGNAPAAGARQQVTISEATTPFGMESYSLAAEEEGGAPATQAGSHPFQLTTTLQLNSGPLIGSTRRETLEEQPALPRNLRFKLPAGLVGNATAIAQCSYTDFTTSPSFIDECAEDTAVGVATVTIIEPNYFGLARIAVPVFNLVPARGEPARFGFLVTGVPVVLDTGVRTGEDYGVTVSVKNTTQLAQFLASTVVFWGVPGDPRHDNSRGWGCVYAAHPEPCVRPGNLSEAPLLRLPTSCSESLAFPMELEPWNTLLGSDVIGEPFTGTGTVGCNKVPFQPEIEAAPDVQDASTPSGLTVHVRVPNETVLTPNGISEGDVRNTTVALPAGVTLNPGGADGLSSCSEAQIGYTGRSESGTPEFSGGAPTCPDSAKVGTVAISTPLLPQSLEGSVYLASPAPAGEAGENPFDSLVALYIVAEDPVSGVLVKLPGRVMPCEAAGEVLAGVSCQEAGQLVSTFMDTPQLPFEDLELHFFGGSNAPLATPNQCGSYTTSALFEPWSLQAGESPVGSSSTFQITSGPNGSACPPSPRAFTPELNVGTINLQAGEYSELRTTMGHPDQDQALGALKMTLPPGLMGSLAHVALCGEPQAAEGTCGPESLIGHTTVTAGLGSTPAVVARPGNVYITGPYKGAPYGLSIANPAETGPFDLEKGTKCDCIVVRAKIEVDPHTAQLTITSDPLPRILDGIPLDLQHVAVQIDRPDFTFNPTSCSKMKIEASMQGAEGALAAISEPFQVANCAALAFKPKFTASTSAKTSRKDGASLHVSVTYPKGSQGTEANLRYVKVELPKALPSELKTLKLACTAEQFDANPAGCPAESIVGHAVVHTPVLPVPLEGPAYFVSNGGEAFPNLIMVLQGYGVSVDLVGDTLISKGITSSTFKSTPDVPFEAFELTLPEQEYSALAANGNLCDQKLVMPTHLVGQNGAEIHQQTPIEVEGCPGALAVRSHRVKKRTLTLKVYAPGAGKLRVSGKGLKAQTRKTRARKIVTLRAHERKTGTLKTKVSIVFTPSTGKTRKRQTKSLHVKFKGAKHAR